MGRKFGKGSLPIGRNEPVEWMTDMWVVVNALSQDRELECN